MIVLDAEGQVVGRICTYAAKQSLLGEDVIIINAEKAILSGKRDSVLKRELGKLGIRNLGNPMKGPFYYRRPDRYVRKAVRGMLPWRTYRGREAYKRIMVYIGTPEAEIKKRHNFEIKNAKIEKIETTKKRFDYVEVGEVCKALGGKF